MWSATPGARQSPEKALQTEACVKLKGKVNPGTQLLITGVPPSEDRYEKVYSSVVSHSPKLRSASSPASNGSHADKLWSVTRRNAAGKREGANQCNWQAGNSSPKHNMEQTKP